MDEIETGCMVSALGTLWTVTPAVIQKTFQNDQVVWSMKTCHVGGQKSRKTCQYVEYEGMSCGRSVNDTETGRGGRQGERVCVPGLSYLSGRQRQLGRA